MQDRQEHRPLEREAVLARRRQLLDHRPAAALLPQPLKHQRRPDPAHGDRRILLRGAQHKGLGGKARARAQQALQLPAGLQLVPAPERRDHLLAHPIALASARDDLQVDTPTRGLLAKVHGDSRGAHRIAANGNSNQAKSIKTWRHL